MKLRIPIDQTDALRAALTRAKSNEIGGQIFGEQLAPSDFRATDLTFQKRPGTFARFIVDLAQAAKDASRFFRRTQQQYRRFNYIGEWHSHPSFEVTPSNIDIDSMRQLVGAKEFKGTFAVLMIVRLDLTQLTCGGWLFNPRGFAEPISLEFES